MSDNLQKIKKILKTSSLTRDEQNDLIRLFAKAGDDELKSVAGLFTKNPNLIKIIYENYREKLSAGQSKDENVWSKILGKEENLLKIYAK